MKKEKGLLKKLIFSVFAFPLVSAYSFSIGNMKDSITRIIEGALEVLSPFLEKIIGDYSTSDFFFAKSLLLILLIIIFKNGLEKTPFGENNKKVSSILAIIISILGIRFINENGFLESILIQYGVLGIAITSILPLVIFFYFIHNTKIGTYGRKMFWTIYAIILAGIWISKSSEIPEVANWIYGLTLIAAVTFIFFDRSIHSYFGLSNFHLFMKRSNREAILRAKERILKLNERRANRIINEYEYRQGIREEEKIIRDLTKE